VEIWKVQYAIKYYELQVIRLCWVDVLKIRNIKIHLYKSTPINEGKMPQAIGHHFGT
jgi:hypothetical protein